MQIQAVFNPLRNVRALQIGYLLIPVDPQMHQLRVARSHRDADSQYDAGYGDLVGNDVLAKVRRGPGHQQRDQDQVGDASPVLPEERRQNIG